MALAARKESRPAVAWAPFPGSQYRFLASPYFETLYEGTRGPGKTEALLCDFAQHVGQGHGRAWRGILFREESTQLEDVVNKTLELFPQIWSSEDARYVGGNQSKWKWSTGEELLFRHMRRRQDYQKYHGHEYPWIGWEELTNWASPVCYHLMKSCCRTSTEGVPLKYRATCNPYGPGHNWVKSYFIDPAEEGEPFTPDVDQVFEQAGLEVPEGVDLTGRKVVRVQGHYTENLALMEAQPDYEAFIAAAAENPAQAKAWLEADWDIVAGGMFDDVWERETHVIEGWPPADTPRHWRIDRAFDYGSSAPFSVGWWAESDGTEAPNGVNYPRGTLFRIAEWYGWNGTPNEGLRLTDREVAAGVARREQQMGIDGRVKAGPADLPPERPGEQSMSSVFRAAGVPFRRVKAKDREAGWAVLRRMLKESRKDRPEKPCFYVFDSCRQFIRTVPTLPRGEGRYIDDVDTEAEDHCLHSDTMVETPDGPKPIGTMVGTEGFVLSVGGRWERYTACRRTRKGAPVVRVVLGNGRSLVCTRDHRIMTDDGRWMDAGDLMPGVAVHSVAPPRPISCGTRSECTQERGGVYASSGYQRHDSKVPRRSVLSVRTLLSAEWTAPTPGGLGGTQRSDSGWLSRASRNGRPEPKPDRRLEVEAGVQTSPRPYAGAEATGKESGGNQESGRRRGGVAQEPRWTRVASRTLRGEYPTAFQRDRGEDVRALRGGVRDSKTDSAKCKVLLESVQGSGPAGVWGGRRGADLRGVRGDVHDQQVPKDADLLSKMCVGDPPVVERVEPAGRADVYCLEVPATAAFAVEGGIVVHNCADETRYRVSSPKRTAEGVDFRV